MFILSYIFSITVLLERMHRIDRINLHYKKNARSTHIIFKHHFCNTIQLNIFIITNHHIVYIFYALVIIIPTFYYGKYISFNLTEINQTDNPITGQLYYGFWRTRAKWKPWGSAIITSKILIKMGNKESYDQMLEEAKALNSNKLKKFSIPIEAFLQEAEILQICFL